MKFGLIAGNGKFPLMVLEAAKKAGEQVAVAAIREETDPRIDQLAETVTWIGIGQLGRMIRFFKQQDVQKAMMAGQVKHVQIFGRAIPDARMLKVLLKLPRRNTDSLIGAIVSELQSEGIEVIDSTYFLQDYLPTAGVLTRRHPDQREQDDIEYGLDIAREIGRLDLGQTIVVRALACVAIEAMEGTDDTIRRAGGLAKGKLTVVKVAKPNQDMRFDVPVVGPPTIQAMVEAGATCLCINAGKTLMFDIEEMIELANREKITVVVR
ncbi:MAG: LpxI family protein [Pyrinomonadaceae bacterium]